MDLKDQVRAEVRIQISAEEDDHLVAKTNSVKSEFKRFDTIDDLWFTDHHFYYSHHKNFSQKIIERLSHECDILREGLTDSIFVRANREKPDLLKAVMIGPEGTPHQDGLFFFDIFFPSNFPSVPPVIRSIHEGASEKYYIPHPNFWSLSRSTLLGSLLSIHEKIVTSAEYIPFEERSQLRDLRVKEGILKFNWRTMVDVLDKPPKYFENFVSGHFYDRAEKILVNCKAYIHERVNTVDHPVIKPPRQEDFDMMESLYCKLADVFRKNGSSLADLSKLGIEFHAKLEPDPCTKEERGRCACGCFLLIILLVVLLLDSH